MNDKYKILNQFFVLGVLSLGRGLQIVGEIVRVRVSTTLMLPRQLGSITQMMSVASIFSMMLVTPIWQYIMRAFIEWLDAGILLKYLLRYFRYVLMVAILVIGAAWLLQWQFHLVNGFSIAWVIVLIGIYIIFSSVNAVGTTGLNLLGRRVEFVVFSNLAIWIGLGLAVVLLLVFSQAAYWILGQYIGIAIASISIFLLFKRVRSTQHISGGTGKIMQFKPSIIFNFVWPQVVTLVLWWFQSQSYRFVLDRVAGIANVGLFSVGYGIGVTLIATFETIFGQFYEPIYYRALKRQGTDGQAKAWNDYASAYLPGVILVGLFVASSGSFLAKVLLGPQFKAAGSVVIWSAIGGLIRAPGAMVHFLGIAKVDMRILIPSAAVGAILAPTGVLLFGRLHPLHGTGLALCLSFLASVGIGIYISLRALPVTWPIRRILLSGLLGVPMIIGFEISKRFVPQPTILSALIVLSLEGLYLLLAEYALARGWMGALQNHD